jgi:hypothetical protein
MGTAPQIVNTVLLVEPRKLDNLPHIISEYYKYLGDNWKYVFYCGKGTLDYWRDRLNAYVELRELEVDNFNTASEYSFFMKQSALWKSLYGEFVLTIQADTWIVNMAPYTIDYFMKLNRSYIGGNMSHVWKEFGRENVKIPFRNFNGGLSLRKRKDILTVIKAFPPKCLEKGINKSLELATDAEDVYFTIGCHRLGLPIGDDEVSSHFAIHNIIKPAFFGIHKPCAKIKNELFRLNPHLHETASHL